MRFPLGYEVLVILAASLGGADREAPHSKTSKAPTNEMGVQQPHAAIYWRSA